MGAAPQSWQRDMDVYRALYAAAVQGKPAPKADQLCELLDEGDGGPVIATTVNIIARLERRGLIQVRRFQREREIMVEALGKWTAPARCRTPHWRARPTILAEA